MLQASQSTEELMKKVSLCIALGCLSLVGVAGAALPDAERVHRDSYPQHYVESSDVATTSSEYMTQYVIYNYDRARQEQLWVISRYPPVWDYGPSQRIFGLNKYTRFVPETVAQYRSRPDFHRSGNRHQ
jgi:hypothetical protein